MTRYPALLPTRRHVVAVMVMFLVIITATATVALTAALSVAQAVGREQVVFDGISVTLLAASVLRLLTMAGPHAVLNAFDQADHSLLSRTPLTGADIVAGRVWLPRVVFTSICAVTISASLTLATLVVEGGIARIVPIFAALAVLLAVDGMTCAVSCGFFKIAVALRPILVGPVLFGFGILIPGVLAIAAFLVSPALVEIFTKAQSMSGALSAMLENHQVRQLVDILHNYQWAVAAVGFFITVVAYFLTRAAAPSNLYQVRRALQGGHHWRTNREFSEKLLGAAGDKDLRLLIRRGIPAWQALDGVADLLPFVVLVALAGNVTNAVAGSPQMTAFATVVNVGIVVAVIGMTSQALTSLLTSDADGPVLRLLSWRPDSLGRYLAAKSAFAAVVLATLGTSAVIFVGTAAAWPGASWLVMCLVVSVAAATEAVCVVVGSAHRPAILRKEIGVSELEPSVSLASGLLTGLVITIAGPLALGALYLPSPGWPITILAAAATIPLAAWIALKVGPRIYVSLEKGTHREQVHRLGHVGSA